MTLSKCLTKKKIKRQVCQTRDLSYAISNLNNLELTGWTWTLQASEWGKRPEFFVD